MPPPSEPVRAAPVLVVDAANTVGARPDGWWRDRAGATRRLRDRLAAAAGLGPVLPGADPATRVVLVVEGAARGVEGVPGVVVEAAPGSGDDRVVEVVARHCAEGAPVTVVTADRGLRARTDALGADHLGPGTLLAALDRAGTAP